MSGAFLWGIPVECSVEDLHRNVIAASFRHFPFWSLKKRTSKKSCLLPAERK
jgi:hypothetical protein